MPPEIIADTPNILFMMVDQMRADAMSCAGNEHIETPGLDRMAAEGTRFSQCVTPVPVCVAARHTFMTGHRCAEHLRFGNNVPDPEPRVPTVQQLLGLAGYCTRGVGKMHFRPVRRHFGFHRMELMEEIPDYRQDDEYLMYLQDNGYGHVREVHGVRNVLYQMPQVSVFPEEHHSSTWVADRTIDFLSQNHDRPFFCWSSWIAPHPPWNPPEPFANMYDPDKLPAPLNADDDASANPTRRVGGGFSDSITPEAIQRIKALYYGSVSLIDKGVGRILRALDEHGLSENTLVIFTSDHGEMLGDHKRWQKGIPDEGSVRVPMLARYPGRVDAGVVNDDLVSLLDMAPTFLDLAGVEYPYDKPLPGASILGSKGGGLAEARDEVVTEIMRGPRRWLSLRQRDWKYNYYLLDGSEELYDLKNDPDEVHDLLMGDISDASRSRASDMKATLTVWEKNHGFEDSLDGNGKLVNAGQDRSEGGPSGQRCNNQFPRWVDQLPADERAALESRGASVLNAMRKETTFTVEDLPLKAFKEVGGSFEGTKYQEMFEDL